MDLTQKSEESKKTDEKTDEKGANGATRQTVPEERLSGEGARAHLKQAPKRGLGERLALAFAILLTTVACLYGLAIVGSVGFTEEELISSFLRDELEQAKGDLERGETPRAAPNTVVYADCVGENLHCEKLQLAPIPAIFRNVREGFTEITEEPSAFVWRGAWAGGTLLIVRSQEGFEEKEQILFIVMLVSILLVFLAGAFLGNRLSRRVMQPVEALSEAIKKASTGNDWHALPPELMTPDEVGSLATICSESLRRLHEALRREKAFTGDASHELRTPLTVIETSAELLELSDLNDRQQAQVARIRRASAQMRDTIEILLEFARATSKKELANGLSGLTPAHSGAGTDQAGKEKAPQEFPPDSVTGVIHITAARWRPYAEEKGLVFSVTREAECPGSHSPALLGIVLSNLMKNAVAYTSTGFITVRETARGVVVENSGAPIPQVERDRIFKPFERGTSRNASGTGLGLSIVRRIATRMGWHVTLEVREAGDNGAPAVNAFFVDLVTDGTQQRADEMRA